MPRQSELQNVKATLARDYAVIQQLIPVFDASFATKYLILVMDFEKVILTEFSRMTKMGEDIKISVPSSVSMSLANTNPVFFTGTFHVDPWGVLLGMRGLSDFMRSRLSSSNLYGKKVGGMSLRDVVFRDDLGAVEKVELRSLGIIKKLLPVSSLSLSPDGTLALKE
ncbi:MAG: hypothetical protein QXH42_07335 [Thermoplasmata archaeon]